MGVLKDVQRAAESYDLTIMRLIANLTETMDKDAEVILNHLYELYKLRDAQIDSAVWDGLIEYQDGTRSIMHHSFTTFLQM